MGRCSSTPRNPRRTATRYGPCAPGPRQLVAAQTHYVLAEPRRSALRAASAGGQGGGARQAFRGKCPVHWAMCTVHWAVALECRTSLTLSRSRGSKLARLLG